MLGSPCFFITEYIIHPLHLSVRMFCIESTHISQIIADCVVNKLVFNESHPTNVFLWKKRTSLLDWLHQHGLLLKSLVGDNNFLTWPLIWRRKTQKSVTYKGLNFHQNQCHNLSMISSGVRLEYQSINETVTFIPSVFRQKWIHVD